MCWLIVVGIGLLPTFAQPADDAPAAIDFEHTEGALEEKAWKGI